MIEEPKILTIKRPSRRPTDTQIAAFKDVPSSFVSDALLGKGALAMNIKPLYGTPHAVGPALTADNSPGDIMGTMAALKYVQPGDMIMTAFAGHQGCASCGDRVLGMFHNSGAAGFVTEGPMRDLSGIIAVGMPAWCTGVNPTTPFTTGPAKMGTPILIGGQKVETGDMIVADADGVVVVPFDQIDHIVAKLAIIKEQEAGLDAKVANGLTIPEKFAAFLESDDVEYID